MRGLWGVAGLVVVVIAAAAVGLIVALGSSSTAVTELGLGDCFDLPARSPEATEQTVELVERVELIDCDEDHQVQVVLVGELNRDGDLEYPPDAELFDRADRGCLDASSLVGDRFGLIPIAPTEDSLNRLGGRFQCLALPFGGGSWTGTLLPSGRSG
jgi:hypothetical protein